MQKENSKLTKEAGGKLPKVLIAASECAPLSKTGGLADVVGTLPKYLKKLGVEARIITPFHRVIKKRYADKTVHLCDFETKLGWRSEYVGIEKLVLDGVTLYLVDNEHYFGDKIYWGGDAEGEQYSYFCKAVLDAMPLLDFEMDIVHCNDWHTAMLPMLARTRYVGGMQEKLKYLLTIHNIAYQGKFSFETVQDLLGVDAKYLTPEYMELNGCADYLKAGVVFADRINTVSPTYAREIKYAYYAEGLEGILSARDNVLSGILNGIDNSVFNPETDPFLTAHYNASDHSGKAKCKAALQKRLGLEARPYVPIIAMVTRLTEQKGLDLVNYVIDELMRQNDMQFILLGSGEDRYESFMREAEERYKGRLCAYIGFDEELAHQIYSGSDFFLMPSRFEPCGLGQMIAMRYGAVPIVRETGGLFDTVQPYNQYTGEGNGFSFANYDACEMRDIIRLALSCWQDEEIMQGLIGYAMTSDYGFEVTAQEYSRLYQCMM